jgi:guanine deaminase
MSSSTVYYGALVNPRALDSFDALPRALDSFDALPRALLAVDNDGEVAWLEEDVAPSALKETLAAHGVADTTQLVELRLGEFLMPGFIDTHTVRIRSPRLARKGC